MKISANQLKGAGMVLLPVLCIALALMVFSVMPKSNEIVLEGTVEIATSSCLKSVPFRKRNWISIRRLVRTQRLPSA